MFLSADIFLLKVLGFILPAKCWAYLLYYVAKQSTVAPALFTKGALRQWRHPLQTPPSAPVFRRCPVPLCLTALSTPPRRCNFTSSTQD